MKNYIGHPLQLMGVTEYRLSGGRAEGMRMMRVRNGLGLDLEISLDRCADIVTLSVNGVNMGYFAPSGYVHPAYYVNRGTEFLKSFTAGFFTTCGLTAVGSPCTDEGEELPLHGTISNTPCENASYCEDEESITVSCTVRDASLFSHKLILKRKYVISKLENKVKLYDVIENAGSDKSPVMVLYHCNMGYPLLSESATVRIPSNGVAPRNRHAAEDIENCLVMEKPTQGYEERCYYHDLKEKDGVAACGIYNHDCGLGLIMRYPKSSLNYFTEWKMMGVGEYVLGLEPGNCTPDGRDVLRKRGTLKFLDAGEAYKTQLEFEFINNERYFEETLCL
jgi:hypothetical protein